MYYKYELHSLPREGADPVFDYKLRWITRDIAVGAAPSSKAALNTIKQAGVEVILNLCTECGNLHEEERAAGFIVYWLPISDAYSPELDELDDALEWLNGQIESGKKVLVHCRFGVGRSGTVIAAYLLKKGLGLKQVLDIMKQTPATPTSRDQRKLIFEYAKKLGRDAMDSKR
ncbi:MAG: dual specificity protein phosphatase family protein [Proteobacteria bacterium]|nr:dual specificity protein phosphatase family protein [Pseudomonadota bacterium]MBU1419003.1 dual specificity protein phosphatase family protein [Pseudomonadota bacterium]MBU1455069.1 dual specificity protein phosphatase family protein [Pseudomonadota bacterium]